MQKLYDTFIGTEIEVKVLNKIPNILSEELEKEIEIFENDKDKAEAILNAASNMIKEKMEENPAFYEKLSEKIKRIIKDYESKRITEEEFLKEALEIKSETRGENQEENLKYDERIRDNKCARAIYDNTEKYINYKEALIEFSLFVDKLFKEKSNKPDWQDIKSIRDDIMNDIDDKLDNLEDWDLWVRYSQKTEFTFVNELTSCYHVPYTNRARRNRSNGLRDYLTVPAEKSQ